MKINVVSKQDIPVEIGELMFSVNLNDDGLKRMIDGYHGLVEDIEKVDANTIEGAKDLMNKVIDFYLGEGAFDKIYEKYPSIFTMKEIVEELVLNISDELEKRNVDLDQSKLAQKYLKKNGKK